MHLANQVVDFLCGQVLQELDWPDLNDAVAGHSGRKPEPDYGDLLPIATCLASGGDGELAVPLAAAWILYDQASNLFDDLQDRDGKPLIWNEWVPARAMQVGLGMIAAGQLCLSKLDAEPEAKQEIMAAYSSTLALAAREQAAVPQNPDLTSYLRHVVGKSGSVFATVAWSGARVHTDDAVALEAMRQFGIALGILLQLLDDCRDLWNGQVRSDLSAETYTLPVLYALSQVDGSRRDQLVGLLQADAKSEAQFKAIYDILEEDGAASYSLALMKVYEQVALEALQQFPPTSTESLVAYVRSFLAPLAAKI